MKIHYFPFVQSMRGSWPTFAACLLLVAGCADTKSTLPPKLELPPRSIDQTSELSRVESATQARSTLVIANPSPPSAPIKLPVPALTQASGSTAADITLNFDELPLPAFIQAVYATALKKNISIDPAVIARKDLVTLRSGKQMTAAEAESSVRLLLKTYGVAVQDVGGLVRIVPDNTNVGYLPEIRRGRALPETPLPLRPIFQMIEMQAVRGNEVTSYLKTLFGDKIRVMEDPVRNALLLSGNGDDVQAALDAIQVLDQPLFRGRNSIRISPTIWSADEMAKRLTEILTQEGYSVGTGSAGGVQFPITLLPVTGINSVIVFAQSKEIVDHIVEWSKVLDKPAEKSVGRSFFSYQVRNTDASRLAETVQQLLSGTPTRAPTATGVAAPVTNNSGVVVDKATNTILFRASGEDYTDIVRLLRELDRTARQVMIEVTVAQLDITDSLNVGVDWIFKRLNSSGLNVTALGGNAAGSVSAGSTIGGGTGSITGFIVGQLDGMGAPRAILTALAGNTKVNILSSPRLISRNGEPASIQVGKSVPIQTQSQTSAATGGGVISSIQYRDTGTILKIKPVIHSSDQVDMDISQEVSDVSSASSGGIASPTITKSSLDTKLTLKHGSTYVLGGLITNRTDKTNSGVPFLKDIPILGQAFKKSEDTTTRSELILLITPYIISDDGEARAVTDAFRKVLGAWAKDPVPPAAAAPPLPLPTEK